LTTAQDMGAEFSLVRLEKLNWLLLAVVTAASGLIFSTAVAKGVLAGGLLANISFRMLKKDLTRVFAGPLEAAKARFFIKYYVRLAVLAVILFLLVSRHVVHLGGLLAGLSTVAISIGIIAAGAARKVFYTAREAS